MKALPPVVVERRQGFSLAFEYAVLMRCQGLDAGAARRRWVRGHVAALRLITCCAKCGTPTPGREHFHLDHIIARGFGGFRHVPENVEPLCHPCHAIKTAADVAAIAKAKRLSGETCAGPSRRPLTARKYPRWPLRKLQSRSTFPKRRD